MKNTSKLSIWFLIPAALVAGATLIGISGCAPERVIQHGYTFTPPDSDEGMMCANACIDAHKACLNTCQTREYKCNKFERKAVRGDAIVEAGNDPACSVVVCENKCADSLSSCYTGCGGSVAKDTTVTKKDPTAPTE